MNDCQNAVIRDQLPDLVHERLDAAARAAVLAHVGGCVDCRDELQLLRDVQAMMTRRTPRMDVAYIVGALPKAPVPRAVTPIAPRRRVWSDWRVAAAVTLLVAGGGSFALMRTEAPAPSAPVAGVEVTANPGQTVAPAAPATAPTGTATNATVASNDERTPADAGSDSRLGELSESQLRTLLDDIQNLKPVPVTEPEPVTIRVDAKIASEGV